MPSTFLQRKEESRGMLRNSFLRGGSVGRGVGGQGPRMIKASVVLLDVWVHATTDSFVCCLFKSSNVNAATDLDWNDGDYCYTR